MAAGPDDLMADLKSRLRDLLAKLLVTHSVSGYEAEMERLCLDLLTPLAERVWRDAQGNVIAQLSSKPGPRLGFLAHKDEVAALVARIEDDGKMQLEPVGGTLPWVYGEGPWEVIGAEPIRGFINIGCMHTSDQSPGIYAIKAGKAPSWPDVRLDCKMAPADLAARGVTVGSPACVARERKEPVYFGDYVGGYALDDKAGVAAAILAAALLRERAIDLPGSVFVVVTSMEEIGITGGVFIPRTLELDAAVALEVAPVAPEYPIETGEAPVVIFKDVLSVYHRGLSRLLARVAEEVTGSVQRQVVRNFGSDTAGASRAGTLAMSACLAFPCENTHGFEVAHLGGIANCARVAADFARRWTEVMDGA
jgi:putative aminopeptidase FrvX